MIGLINYKWILVLAYLALIFTLIFIYMVNKKENKKDEESNLLDKDVEPTTLNNLCEDSNNDNLDNRDKTQDIRIRQLGVHEILLRDKIDLVRHSITCIYKINKIIPIEISNISELDLNPVKREFSTHYHNQIYNGVKKVGIYEYLKRLDEFLDLITTTIDEVEKTYSNSQIIKFMTIPSHFIKVGDEITTSSNFFDGPYIVVQADLYNSLRDTSSILKLKSTCGEYFFKDIIQIHNEGILSIVRGTNIKYIDKDSYMVKLRNDFGQTICRVIINIITNIPFTSCRIAMLDKHIYHLFGLKRMEKYRFMETTASNFIENNNLNDKQKEKKEKSLIYSYNLINSLVKQDYELYKIEKPIDKIGGEWLIYFKNAHMEFLLIIEDSYPKSFLHFNNEMGEYAEKYLNKQIKMEIARIDTTFRYTDKKVDLKEISSYLLNAEKSYKSVSLAEFNYNAEYDYKIFYEEDIKKIRNKLQMLKDIKNDFESIVIEYDTKCSNFEALLVDGAS